MSFLEGKKTYIAAGIGILLALAGWAGFLPDGLQVDPGNLFMTSVMFFFTRLGIAKSA